MKFVIKKLIFCHQRAHLRFENVSLQCNALDPKNTQIICLVVAIGGILVAAHVVLHIRPLKTYSMYSYVFMPLIWLCKKGRGD